MTGWARLILHAAPMRLLVGSASSTTTRCSSRPLKRVVNYPKCGSLSSKQTISSMFWNPAWAEAPDAHRCPTASWRGERLKNCPRGELSCALPGSGVLGKGVATDRPCQTLRLLPSLWTDWEPSTQSYSKAAAVGPARDRKPAQSATTRTV